MDKRKSNSNVGPKIVICGHYGSTNIGDEVLSLGLIQTIRQISPASDITMLTYNIERTADFYESRGDVLVNTEYLLPFGFKSGIRSLFKDSLKKTLKSIKECDYFVMGGGGLFNDEWLFSALLWGLHAWVARKYKKKVLMVAQSVGPLTSRLGKWITRIAFSKSDLIIVRDDNSKNILEEIGVKNEIIVSTDALFGLKNDHKLQKSSNGLNLHKKVEQEGFDGYIICSIKKVVKIDDIMYKKIVHSIGMICQKYNLKAVFLPFQVYMHDDSTFMNKIIDQNEYSRFFEVKKYTTNIAEIFDYFQGAKLVVGVRLHSLLFSIFNEVPFVGFSYSDKVRDFMKSSDLGEWVLNFEDEDILSLDILVEHIMAEDPQIRAKIKEKNVSLQKEWETTTRKLQTIL